MNRSVKAVFIVVGVLCVAFAILGLWYNSASLAGFLKHADHDPEAPYFVPAYIIMSAICVVCCGLLFIFGGLLVLMKTRISYAVIGVLLFEVAYFFSVGLFFFFIGLMGIAPARGLAMSVARAMGIANGGLMFQFMVLFPVWGALLLLWAQRKVRAQTLPPEPI